MSFRHFLLSGDILFGPVRALRQTDHQIWLGLETGVWNLTGNTDGFQFPVSSFKKKGYRLRKGCLLYDLNYLWFTEG